MRCFNFEKLFVLAGVVVSRFVTLTKKRETMMTIKLETLTYRSTESILL